MGFNIVIPLISKEILAKVSKRFMLHFLVMSAHDHSRIENQEIQHLSVSVIEFNNKKDELKQFTS